jgi:hypothetical protein
VAAAGAVDGAQLLCVDGVATTVCALLNGPVSATIAATTATTSGNHPAQIISDRVMMLSCSVVNTVAFDPLRSVTSEL